ncbi:MAG TPA: C1 family peptidase [Syntrophorhabdales bacterium]|nr:C1 family peptidase [Syntrophorhabdales bacterium]
MYCQEYALGAQNLFEGKKVMRRDRLAGVIPAMKIVVLILLLSASISYAQVEEIQTAIRLRGHQWVAGETSVSHLPAHEKKMRTGLIKPTHTAGAPVLAEQQTEPATGSPASLDWRNNSGNSVTPVRNQGNCGSCWAFATTAALESALIRSGVPAAGLDKSEQVLVSCGGAGSCAGGYISTASQFIQNTGLPAETCYPYTATDGTCSAACSNWQSSTSKISSWSWVTTSSPTVTALKNGLNSYGPLVTTMDVYNDFFYYTSGIYAHTSGSYAGGHAVLLVGYDDPGQYFIVKNSWGTGWGESGFFRIAYTELTSVVGFGEYTIAYTPAPVSGDSAPPTVTNFVIPSTSTSLTVTITTFTATDNVAVTGYLLTETSSTPSASASGWSATAPATYTFSSAGTKTLYAWAKDAAGNVSTSATGVVTITLADLTPPTVTNFVIPSTSTSLTVTITTFTATDNVAVTGYLLTETSSTPSASASGWSATAPATYTFSSAGSKTLYAWAKDAAGNVSTGVSRGVTITLADSSAPTITGFIIPSTSTSLTVTITTFTATDNVAVTGYLLTETSSTPSASASGWSATAPATYTFSSAGTRTLYAWAKDAAGNVSNSLNRTVVITLPVAPSLEIFGRQTQSGDVAVWYMNGTTITGSAYITTIPPPWQIEGVGDFNNDGKPDILWRQTQSGDVAVWYMNGTTVTRGVYVATIPPPWQIEGVGDFNGDGKADILWRQAQSGDVAVWYMNGTTVTQGVYVGLLPLPWRIEGVYQ